MAAAKDGGGVGGVWGGVAAARAAAAAGEAAGGGGLGGNPLESMSHGWHFAKRMCAIIWSEDREARR